MIWSYITSEGHVPLYFVEGTMRPTQYIVYRNQAWMISKFTSIGMALKFYGFYSYRILLDIPKIQGIQAQKPHDSSFKRKYNLYIWNNDAQIRITICNCIASMPQRIDVVLKSKGGQTKDYNCF